MAFYLLLWLHFPRLYSPTPCIFFIFVVFFKQVIYFQSIFALYLMLQPSPPKKTPIPYCLLILQPLPRVANIICRPPLTPSEGHLGQILFPNLFRNHSCDHSDSNPKMKTPSLALFPLSSDTSSFLTPFLRAFQDSVLLGSPPTSMASYHLLGHRCGFLLLSLPLLSPWTPVYTYSFVISSIFLLERPSPLPQYKSPAQVPLGCLAPTSNSLDGISRCSVLRGWGLSHTQVVHTVFLVCAPTHSSHSPPHPIPFNSNSVLLGAQTKTGEFSETSQERRNVQASHPVLNISHSHLLQCIIRHNLMITTVLSPSAQLPCPISLTSCENNPFKLLSQIRTLLL